MISLSMFLITPILELLRKNGLSSDDSNTDEDNNDSNTDNDDDECDNDPVLAHVELAKTVREWISHLLLL